MKYGNWPPPMIAEFSAVPSPNGTATVDVKKYVSAAAPHDQTAIERLTDGDRLEKNSRQSPVSRQHWRIAQRDETGILFLDMVGSRFVVRILHSKYAFLLSIIEADGGRFVCRHC